MSEINYPLRFLNVPQLEAEALPTFRELSLGDAAQRLEILFGVKNSAQVLQSIIHNAHLLKAYVDAMPYSIERHEERSTNPGIKLAGVDEMLLKEIGKTPELYQIPGLATLTNLVVMCEYKSVVPSDEDDLMSHQSIVRSTTSVRLFPKMNSINSKDFFYEWCNARAQLEDVLGCVGVLDKRLYNFNMPYEFQAGSIMPIHVVLLADQLRIVDIDGTSLLLQRLSPAYDESGHPPSKQLFKIVEIISPEGVDRSNMVPDLSHALVPASNLKLREFHPEVITLSQGSSRNSDEGFISLFCLERKGVDSSGDVVIHPEFVRAIPDKPDELGAWKATAKRISSLLDNLKFNEMKDGQVNVFTTEGPYKAISCKQSVDTLVFAIIDTRSNETSWQAICSNGLHRRLDLKGRTDTVPKEPINTWYLADHQDSAMLLEQLAILSHSPKTA